VTLNDILARARAVLARIFQKDILVHFLAVLSMIFGLLVVLQTIGGTVQAFPQMTMTEFPWIPIIICLLVIAYAWRAPRAPIAIAIALVGIYFASQPIWQIIGTPERLDATMRAALGEDYESQIPDGARMAASRFSLFDALGARNFSSQATITENVQFFAAPERNLLLDVYEPQVEPGVGDSYPAIIVLHGGSWNWASLNKSVVFGVHDRYLASLGYVVFDMEYRLSQEAIWPAQLQDIHCAIAWIRTNAAQYNVDPERIALLGRSAGAQLALVAGFRPNDPTVDLSTCGMEGIDTSVSAIVAYYPPTDMRLWNAPVGDFIPQLLGGIPSEVPDAYADASPTNWVRDGLPPTMLLTGYMDNYVVPYHSEYLNNLLLATDTTVVVERLTWARHGFDALIGGLASQMTEYDVDRFLAWSFYHDVP
jgi:acetyl esterase/lipase